MINSQENIEKLKKLAHGLYISSHEKTRAELEEGVRNISLKIIELEVALECEREKRKLGHFN